MIDLHISKFLCFYIMKIIFFFTFVMIVEYLVVEE